MFNSKGESSVFMSKVPNCNGPSEKKESAPGPGQYQGESLTGIEKGKESSSLISASKLQTQAN